MDYIIRNTTPIFTLKIIDDIPEGALPTVTITQGDVTLMPELDFDVENKTVSFSLTSEESGEFEAGSELYIQQTMTLPNGYVESFPTHPVFVEEMLYQGEPVSTKPSTMVVIRDTTDTTVKENVVYYDVLYTETPVTENDSPLDMGLLVFSNGTYELSQDTTPVEGVVYYTEGVFPVDPVGNENPAQEGWKVIEEAIKDIGDLNNTIQDDSLYQPVVVSGNENPSELGWLEIDKNDLYVLTLDTSPVSGKMYYTALSSILPDNVDAFYANFDKQAFYARNNLTPIDNVDFSASEYAAPDDATEWTVNSDSTGGMVPKEA